MDPQRIEWSAVGRVVVTRAKTTLTADDLDALAAVLRAVATRTGKRLLLVQIATLSGKAAIHHVARDGAGPLARYVAAVRAHVEEVHAIAAGGGVLGAALRGLVSTVTKLGASPSILHRDLDALLENLRTRHAVDAAELRACITRLSAK